MPRPENHYRGLLAIGDPHLEGRQPGFRKDDYPNVILGKVQQCLDYAAEHRLLPVFLGDVFDKPRDNPTWMLGRLVEMLAGVECIGIYGNHDCANPQLGDDDSLSLLVKAGSIRLVDADHPWTGLMQGRRVTLGGSSYRMPIPGKVATDGEGALTIWLAHHDVYAPEDETRRGIKPHAIEGVDLLINGHIHRRLDDVKVGRTTWVTPGNISRRTRGEATCNHVPAALRVDVTADELTWRHVPLQHAPFAEVFHEAADEEAPGDAASAFVAGLAELQARSTESGAGLQTFLDANLDQFKPKVAAHVRRLAEEVLSNG